MIDTIILTITFIIGIIGWLSPSEKPFWLIIGFCVVLFLGLVFEIIKNIQSNKDTIKDKEEIKKLLEKTTRSSEIEVYVNNQLLKSDTCFVEVNEKCNYEFIFKLKNVGNKYADKVQIYLECFNINLFAKMGRNWIDHGDLEVNVDNKFGKIQLLKSYVFISPTAIYPGNWMSAGHCIIDKQNRDSSFPIKFKMYYDDNKKLEITINIEIN